jgi:hypothetical protein
MIDGGVESQLILYKRPLFQCPNVAHALGRTIMQPVESMKVYRSASGPGYRTNAGIGGTATNHVREF